MDYKLLFSRYSIRMYFVYLLECADKSIYTGIATDVLRRFKEHGTPLGARYTRSRKPSRILYTESLPTRSAALKREAEIKTWNRERKLELAKAGDKLVMRKS